MSYDLMVFDVQAAPRDLPAFMRWYDEQTQWSEEHGYDDPSVSSPPLKAWFLDMIPQFPAMNGPHASDDVDDPRITDYSVGRTVIYAAFAWSEAEAANRAVASLARRHGLGFFDLGSEEAVLVPVGDGYQQMPAADGGG